MDDKKYWWPCGCVKRSKDRFHIRLNSPTVKRCRRCKAEQPPDWVESINRDAALKSEKPDCTN